MANIIKRFARHRDHMWFRGEFDLLGLRLKGAIQKQKAAKLSGVTAFWDCVYLHSRLIGENRTTSESGRTPDAVDFSDLPGKGDEVHGVPDELERRRPVQTVRDDGQGPVPVDLEKRPGLRHRITRVNTRVDHAVREGVETAAAAKFHVKEEGGAGGYLYRRWAISAGTTQPCRLGAGGGSGPASAMYTVLPLTSDVSEKVVSHIASMDADSILTRGAQVEKIDSVARRTFGLDSPTAGSGAVNLNVLCGGRAVVQVNQKNE